MQVDDRQTQEPLGDWQMRKSVGQEKSLPTMWRDRWSRNILDRDYTYRQIFPCDHSDHSKNME